MSLLMGVTMSFCLSLTGNLTSGEGFQLMPFLISFAVSTVISILIGIIVPMRKLEGGAVSALKLKEHSLPAKLVSALVSDLIYTPVITLAMIKDYVSVHNESTNGFIVRAIREAIERDDI